MKYPWIRILKIVLRNSVGSEITIGGKGSNHLTINVVCNKYLSALKDDATIRVENLSYTEILKIVTGKYYDVEIWAGYENRGSYMIFSGGVLYASNALKNRKTTELILLCASKMIAKFGQVKMSLTINSSINVYSALSFVCRHVGIKDAVIPKSLAKQTIEEYRSFDNQSIQTTLEYFSKAYQDVISGISTDASSNSSTVQIIPENPSDQNVRIVVVSNDTIDLSGGYPRMTNSGLNITVIPTKPIYCGDILKVDNSLINISTSSRDQMNLGLKLNAQGLYRVKQMEYNLTNRSQEFSLNLICMLQATSPEKKSIAQSASKGAIKGAFS